MIDWPETTHPFFEAMTPTQQRAATLVYVLNAAASATFKARYARRWWGLVEARVKLCAMTSPDLVRWSSTMAARLDGDLARNAEHREAWRAAVAEPDAALVLDALQQDTAVLVAFCRAVSEARRDAFQAERATETAEDTWDPAPPDDAGDAATQSLLPEEIPS